MELNRELSLLYWLEVKLVISFMVEVFSLLFNKKNNISYSFDLQSTKFVYICHY